jgi:D-beta-D-heptose 7-phosphate kinase/D-beta-D-heptose 1-phosphate adenosyltransferase
VVAALRAVDAVVLFGSDTPLSIIEALKPDILVKGGDYDSECTDPHDPRYIVGSAEVRSTGGQVATIDLVPGRSTTAIASKLKGQ